MERSAASRVDADQFRIGMRCLAGAVNIITAVHAGQRYGMTATAVCSATADPPTVLVCVNRHAATHAAIARSGAFCVNVLRAEDAGLANAFSGSQTGDARFRTREWTRVASGSPALAGALASFDCRVAQSLDHGTHTVFLGEVLGLAVGRKGDSLLYAGGQYARLTPLALGAPLPENLEDWGG